GGGGPLGPCDLPVGSKILFEEHFQTNVFADPDAGWARSHDSVMVDSQQLLISMDDNLDDYADHALADGALPLIVQVRAAMMTSGHSHRWPVVDLIGANNVGRVTIDY